MELISIEIFSSWGTKETWSSMISEVEEDLGVLGRLENLTSCRFITSKNLKNVLSGDFFSLVVNLAAIVDINTWSTSGSWLVEELVREFVLS